MTRAKPATSLALAFGLALCFAPCVAAQGGQDTAAPDPSKGFQRARRASADVPPDRAAFEFEANGFSYHVGANGSGRRMKGNRTRRFNLQLDGRDFIEGLRFTLYEGDLLLVCELNDGETRTGFVTRLEQPSMRALWRQSIPAREVGEPLREGHALYVTGAGFVARLELRTGIYDWQHEDLGDVDGDASGVGAAQPFAPFETPELAGDAVLFRERPVYNRRRVVVIKKKTGEIIRIE
jgi:hypothetical protein